jgi:hypothetical protein
MRESLTELTHNSTLGNMHFYILTETKRYK